MVHDTKTVFSYNAYETSLWNSDNRWTTVSRVHFRRTNENKKLALSYPRVNSCYKILEVFYRYFSAHEMIPKTICQSAYSTDGPAAISEICRLVTRSGLSNSTLNFLRLCNIMEPMTELFTFHKVNSFGQVVSYNFDSDISNGPKRMFKKLSLSKME